MPATLVVMVDVTRQHPALALGAPYPPLDPAVFNPATTSPVVLASEEPTFDSIFDNVMESLGIAELHPQDHRQATAASSSMDGLGGMQMDMTHDVTLDMHDDMGLAAYADADEDEVLFGSGRQYSQAHHTQQQSDTMDADDAELAAMTAQRQACMAQQQALEGKLSQLLNRLRVQQLRTSQLHAHTHGVSSEALHAERHNAPVKGLEPQQGAGLANMHLFRRRIEGLQRELDPDATEESSAEEEEDEGPEDYAVSKLTRKRRKVQSRWDRVRADVGWRWNWLRERMADVETDLQVYKCAARELRYSKTDIFHADPLEVRNSCARGAVTIIPGKRRKLCHARSPTVMSPLPTLAGRVAATTSIPPSDPHTIQIKSAAISRSFHPVLSFAADAPFAVLAASRRHRRALALQHEADKATEKLQRVAPGMPLFGGGAVGVGGSDVPLDLDLETGAMADHAGAALGTPAAPAACAVAAAAAAADVGGFAASARRPHHRSSVGGTPRSPRPSGIDLMASASSSSFRRRRMTSEIDDVMLPAQLAPSHVEPIMCKEILTPAWVSAQLPQFSADELFAAMSEDLTDEAYLRRHQQFESKEITSFTAAVSAGPRRTSTSDGTPPGSASEPPAKRMRRDVRSVAHSSDAGYPARSFPLSAADMASLDAPGMPEPVPVYMVIAQSSVPSEVAETSGAPVEAGEEKPIKLVFKLTNTASAPSTAQDDA